MGNLQTPDAGEQRNKGRPSLAKRSIRRPRPLSDEQNPRVWPKTAHAGAYRSPTGLFRSKGRKPRLYVSFPLVLAAAIGLEPGEEVQWELLDRGELHLLTRANPPPPSIRKKA